VIHFQEDDWEHLLSSLTHKNQIEKWYMQICTQRAKANAPLEECALHQQVA